MLHFKPQSKFEQKLMIHLNIQKFCMLLTVHWK